MRVVLFYALFFAALLCNAQKNLSDYVNPFIGTGGHGHTFPGPVLPFGMVQLSPDTRIDGSWDGCSGYHYSDEYIYGFSHTHLSGTGCSDYGDIALLPFDAKINPVESQTDWLKLKHSFNHKNEKAKAGYYAVKMDNNIMTELTCGQRFGMHKYSFPKKSTPGLLVKITHRDKTIASDLKVIDNYRLEGYRRSEAWAKDQHIYFVIEFSSPLTQGYAQGFGGNNGEEGIDYMNFTFKELKGKPLFVKVGISNVSIEGARNNLKSECTTWNFDEVKNHAAQEWNRALGKIEIGADEAKSILFYTALYHCMIHPSLASDADGKYRGRDNQIHEATGFNYYSVFSLWDTFRGLHPLFTITDKKRTGDFIQTFLKQYEQGGRLPVWELSSNETDCMIGYHSVSVIVDAYMKGIRNFDQQLALKAMINSANFNHLGLPAYNEKLFLEVEDEHESVSKTLEYSYNNWCIATFAKAINENKIADEFYLRSKSWMNLFDSKTGFIRPRSNGMYAQPFDPFEVNNNYTEANAWQYTFFVPHDLKNLIAASNGEKNFEKKLDELFSAKTQTTGRQQADITGLVGQYAHGNEPSHHMAYLYNYIGKSYKTQEKINYILENFYKNAPDGLIGNEDCGQMSAWYVLSAIGFYPVCPGDVNYAAGNPQFTDVYFHLENNTSTHIKTNNISVSNIYLDANSPRFLTHEELNGGKEIVFNKTNQPTEKDKNAIPITAVENQFVKSPLIVSESKTFRRNALVSITGEPNQKIKYSLCNSSNEKIDSSNAKEYLTPFQITKSSYISAYAIDEKGNHSKIVQSYLHCIPHDYTITIKSKYNPQYTAGGDAGIIDGLKGDENWRKGGWQGYQAQDFECIVDMNAVKSFQSVTSSYLQDARAWIFMPTQVSYEISKDGVQWESIGTVKNDVSEYDEKTQIKAFEFTNASPLTGRYIRVKAKNFGRLPVGHIGYGMEADQAFIFIDEIEIK